MASGIDRRCPRWRRHSMLCGCSRDTGGTRNRGPANCGCLIYGLQCLHASIRPSTRRFTRRSFFTTTCAHGCNGSKNGLAWAFRRTCHGPAAVTSHGTSCERADSELGVAK
ncbi:hypothetical protein VFPBJ_02762 [Purpureocillium lilacinum]|uniref:Uncharacterized protein n=1 Tax=Purpureocillium lilacinum TaxID=33203 RepID=A0A179H1H5_PURLI|nr:hypothetical protein VFPBJ_02762 [Purpureocillium lilacinum]